MPNNCKVKMTFQQKPWSKEIVNKCQVFFSPISPLLNPRTFHFGPNSYDFVKKSPHTFCTVSISLSTQVPTCLFCLPFLPLSPYIKIMNCQISFSSFPISALKGTFKSPFSRVYTLRSSASNFGCIRVKVGRQWKVEKRLRLRMKMSFLQLLDESTVQWWRTTVIVLLLRWLMFVLDLPLLFPITISSTLSFSLSVFSCWLVWTYILFVGFDATELWNPYFVFLNHLWT